MIKKLIIGFGLLMATTASYAETYSCTAYMDGKVVGEKIKVNASKAAVAEAKAQSRLKKAGVVIDYVACK